MAKFMLVFRLVVLVPLTALGALTMVLLLIPISFGIILAAGPLYVDGTHEAAINRFDMFG